MSELKLGNSRIFAGVWEGVLTGASGAPDLEVLHQEQPIAGVTVAALEDPAGAWAIKAPIPSQLLCDGVQTFLIRDKASAQTLGHFTIITGVVMEVDIRAEMDLLRAELDMLKRAFRRHCLETAG